MKIRQVNFKDDDMPTDAVASITVEELALIYAFVGTVAPKTVTDASGIEWGNTLFDLAESLSEFFNLFWDGGAWDVAPRFSVNVAAPSSQKEK